MKLGIGICWFWGLRGVIIKFGKNGGIGLFWGTNLVFVWLIKLFGVGVVLLKFVGILLGLFCLVFGIEEEGLGFLIILWFWYSVLIFFFIFLGCVFFFVIFGMVFWFL